MSFLYRTHVNIHSKKLLKKINVGSGPGNMVHYSGNIYVSTCDGKVSIICGSSDTVIGSFNYRSTGIKIRSPSFLNSLSPRSKSESEAPENTPPNIHCVEGHLFLNKNGSKDFKKIDLSDNSVINFKVNFEPTDITGCGNMIFLRESGTSNFSIFDLNHGKITQNITYRERVGKIMGYSYSHPKSFGDLFKLTQERKSIDLRFYFK